MTEQTNDMQPDELTILKQRATLMGITFSNNIKVETLREKIQAKLNGEQSQEEEAGPNPFGSDNVSAAPAAPKKSLRQQIHEEQMKLVRLRITNLDPKKANLPGEIFTVANKFIGNVRKFIPYGEVTDDGYHVPYCIYKQLDARKFLHIRTYRDRKTGQQKVETKWAKEFALEILPPLTKAEIDRLAAAQAAAGSLDSESAL